jgi:para-nitrobenzyl esterase
MYIHGGNFVEGAGSQSWTEPSALALRGDLVVVTVNYRLGALGWLFLEDIGGSEVGAVCNAGLLDQIAALRWIARNIGAFGGDPGNVTVFGYSAGAWSISALLAAGEAPRLFQKAIVMSGGVRSHSRQEATALTQEILDELAIGSGPVELRRLWDLRPQAFSRALRQVWNRNGHPFPPIRPVAGATPIPSDPIASIWGGVAAHVPIIVGSTLDEFKLVATMDVEAADLHESGLLKRFVPDFGEKTARALIKAYREARTSRGEKTTATDLYWAIRSDQMFSVPGARVAEAQSANEPSTFMYQVRWAGGDPRLGACHSVDLALVFGTLGLNGMETLSGAGPDAQALAHRIQDAWAAFARRGDPSHPAIPLWPRYDATQRATMIFDRPCYVMEGPLARERMVWNGIL